MLKNKAKLHDKLITGHAWRYRKSIIISFSRTLDMMHNMIDLAIKFWLILVIASDSFASASESLDKKEGIGVKLLLTVLHVSECVICKAGVVYQS